jgi:hypothetical protein
MLHVQDALATFEFRRSEERQHFRVFVQEFRMAAQPGGNRLGGQAVRLDFCRFVRRPAHAQDPRID